MGSVFLYCWILERLYPSSTGPQSSAGTLQTPSAVLHGYGNSKIDLVASLSCPVRHGNTSLATFTFQVARHGANLMGLDLITSLGFTFMDSGGATIHQVSSPWEQRWPALFSGQGCITASTPQPDRKSTRLNSSH